MGHLYAKAIERQDFPKDEHAAKCFPKLASTGKNHSQLGYSLGPRAMATHIGAVRDLILELASEDVTNDTQQLRNSSEDDGEDRSRCKENIIRKLRRLSLGEACQLSSIVDDEGVIHISAGEMAEALSNHWKSVFSATDCDDGMLTERMEHLFPGARTGS